MLHEIKSYVRRNKNFGHSEAVNQSRGDKLRLNSNPNPKLRLTVSDAEADLGARPAALRSGPGLRASEGMDGFIRPICGSDVTA